MNYSLAEKIEKIKQAPINELCEKFHCKPKEICMGDYIARNTEDTVCPYKVILGHADFERSNVTDLGKLEIVYGRRLEAITDVDRNPIYLGINLANSKISNLGNLRKVFGSITLNEFITSMGNVQYLGSNLFLNKTYVEDLGELKQIHGRLNLEDVKGRLRTLKNLEKVGSIYVDIKTLLDLGELSKVQNITYGKHCSPRVVQLFKNRFARQEVVENLNN